MKITLESTPQIVTNPATGNRCRVWEGTTESGIKIFAMISSIAVSAEDSQADFQRELEEQPHKPLTIDWRLLV